MNRLYFQLSIKIISKINIFSIILINNLLFDFIKIFLLIILIYTINRISL